MSRPILLNPNRQLPTAINPVELFFRCAGDRDDTAHWSEFLRLYTCKIRYFIRGTLRKLSGSAADRKVSILQGAIQENDLLQNIILRLVENDCALMKRFSGSTEDELLAYLAVITRSVVVDTFRRQRRFHSRKHAPARPGNSPGNRFGLPGDADRSDPEREILGRELASLTQRTIENLSGPASTRDLLIFDLYFTQGLSCQQIAECRGVNMSRGGIEKLLGRLVDRVRSRASSGTFEANRDEK